MKVNHECVIFEYNQITPNIFLGTTECCITHFKKELLKKGISAVISMREKHQDKPFGVKSYLWLPTKDHTAPSQDQLDLGVSFIRNLVSKNKKVYIHCKQGHGRAPTLTAAYLISTGLITKEALKLIKKNRPVIHPNKKQIKDLEKFEKRLKK